MDEDEDMNGQDQRSSSTKNSPEIIRKLKEESTQLSSSTSLPDLLDTNKKETMSSDTNNNNNNRRRRNGTNGPSSTPQQYKTNAEYTLALNNWMLQCCAIQWMQYSLNYSMMSMASLATQQQNQRLNNLAGQPPNSQQSIQQGRVYHIPKLWKRVIAELIDFFLLLILKIMVTFIAIDYLEIITDLDKFDFTTSFLQQTEKDASKLLYDLTWELISIEIIHRAIVIGFEALCLRKGQNQNNPGGSTPGKAILRLKVVSCSQIDDLGNGTVRVLPSNNVGFWWSLLRAVIKNSFPAVLLPISFTVIASSHNRAIYDIASRCVVVEEINPNNLNQGRMR